MAKVKQLWKAADKLRKNIDVAEYKHVVMGLVFLKYISDSLEELYRQLKAGEGDYAGADPEDRDEYQAENVFFVPPTARWSLLLLNAKLPNIGKIVHEAMDVVEKDNSSLKGVLPKVYARDNLDSKSLGGLIDLIDNIALGDAKARSADVLGRVFEYFLDEFVLAEGKQGGQFYTPKSVVEFLRPRNVLDTSIVYLFLKQQDTLNYLQVLSESRSDTFPQITFDHLKTVEIFVPKDKDILESATNIFKDIVTKTFSNNATIKTLENMRDILLPKLMSGEIRINYE